MRQTKIIPLMTPYVPEAAIRAVERTLRTRWIGQGPQVAEFEQRFSRLVHGRSCVAVGSCTDALHLSYLLAGIGPGDEVIAPLFTCTATNIPLLYCGAKIRFCDVEPGGLNMDPQHARSLITEKTKAIVVVHYGGAKVSSDLFDRGLPVIEDCAQALGPWWPGSRGDFACFSFQAVKHVTTGDGGMLVLPGSLAAKAKRMRWFGIDRDAKLAGTWANDITEVGYKYQMTDIAAAMGMAGLDSLHDQIVRRRLLRDTYLCSLRGLDGIRVTDQDPDSACWLCTVAVERRDDFRRKLASEGVESDQVHYRNDRYGIFAEHVRAPSTKSPARGASCAKEGQFPNMDAIESKYLAIPLHMGMDLGDVERICDVIRSGW